jgi:hypothetical protein
MRNATLVWRSADHPRHHIQVLENFSDNANKLMDAIFKAEMSKRIVITKNRYYYNPTDEYKSYMIRFKGIK